MFWGLRTQQSQMTQNVNELSETFSLPRDSRPFDNVVDNQIPILDENFSAFLSLHLIYYAWTESMEDYSSSRLELWENE